MYETPEAPRPSIQGMGAGTASPVGIAPGALIEIGTTVNHAETLREGRVELVILSTPLPDPSATAMGAPVFQESVVFQNDGQSDIQVRFRWAVPATLQPGSYPLIWTVYNVSEARHIVWMSVFRFDLQEPQRAS